MKIIQIISVICLLAVIGLVIFYPSNEKTILKTKPIQNKENIDCWKKVIFENHLYLIYRDYSASGVAHSPDCGCTNPFEMK